MPSLDLAAALGLQVPVVAAPMAGGPSTPELVVAVIRAGGGGFLAGAGRSVVELREQIRRVRALTDRPFGVNLFVPRRTDVDPAALDAYARRLAPLARRLGAEPGTPTWDDDGYAAKLDVLVGERVPLVSFTFGLPARADVDRLHAAGAVVLATVTTPDEARRATAAGADALVVQGAEAGAHRGSLDEGPAEPGAGALPLLDLLPRVAAVTPLPLVAAGGLMSGPDVAAARAAGAVTAQLGTAFLCCPEAGTAAVHRQALLDPAYTATAFTRAFTGRVARSLVNEFVREHGAAAPTGYPQVHHLTAPLRAAAARRGDAGAVHLWAGAGWRRIRPLPAADLVALLDEELARDA